MVFNVSYIIGKPLDSTIQICVLPSKMAGRNDPLIWGIVRDAQGYALGWILTCK
jgi:hypothetical protein